MPSKPSWHSSLDHPSPLPACRTVADITWPEVKSRLEEISAGLRMRVRQRPSEAEWLLAKAEWEGFQWALAKVCDMARKYQGATNNYQWELCKRDVSAEVERQWRELDKCKKWDDYMVIDARLKYLDMVLDVDFTLQSEVKNSQEEAL